MTQLIESENYGAAFARLEESLNGERDAWVHGLRRAGFARFEEVGFPTTREEAFRHTSVERIRATDYRRAPEVSLSAEQFAHFAGCPVHGPRLVFVNGRFAADLSNARALPEGVRIRSLAEALRAEPDRLEGYLGRVVDMDKHAFAALNTAFLEDGAFVHIGRWRAVSEPIIVLNLFTAPDGPAVSYPRALVVAEEGSAAQVVEIFAGVGSGETFTNAVTEVVVGEGANLDHIKIQRESPAGAHVANMAVRQAARSVFTTHAITLGGALARNDITVRLEGQEAEAALNGLYIADGRQHVDTHTVIDHAVPRCASHETYHGILSGEAHGVFAGKIIVHPDAQQTDARQSCRNLVLSPEAVADAMPQLEIFADDVKCTHGATIGSLDEEAVFYLRARGVPEKAARGLLTHAFANTILEGLRVEPMRDRLQEALLARFTQEGGTP